MMDIMLGIKCEPSGFCKTITGTLGCVFGRKNNLFEFGWFMQVFAMPEVAVGLHTDCSFSYILPRLSGHLGQNHISILLFNNLLK
jgi:Enoyl-CoA hydratase/isomerase